MTELTAEFREQLHQQIWDVFDLDSMTEGERAEWDDYGRAHEAARVRHDHFANVVIPARMDAARSAAEAFLAAVYPEAAVGTHLEWRTG